MVISLLVVCIPSHSSLFIWTYVLLMHAALYDVISTQVTVHAIEGGGHVFQRHENLTKRVGPLPKNWEKKLDAVCAIKYMCFVQITMATIIFPTSCRFISAFAVTKVTHDCAIGQWALLLQESRYAANHVG